MIGRLHRRRLHGLHREEGQAAIELMLILPIYVLFLLLMVDLGVMMYEYVSVSNAVREGARYGAVNCSDGGCDATSIAGRTVERSGGILSDPAEVEVGWVDNNGDGTNAGRGDSVVVRAVHPYSFLFFPATIDVVSCADMRLEQRDRTAALPGSAECSP